MNILIFLYFSAFVTGINTGEVGFFPLFLSLGKNVLVQSVDDSNLMHQSIVAFE